MADLVLQYRRAGAGVITPMRRKVGAMLAAAALGLVVFAGIVGWVLVDRLVKERTLGRGVIEGGAGGRLFLVHRVVIVYHWDRLVWVAGAMAGLLVLAGAYWILGRAIRRRPERTLTVAALTLAILHTLGATLTVLYVVLVGSAYLHFQKFSVTVVLSVIGSIVGAAMVPGMLWVSIRLMDLLGERVMGRRGKGEILEVAPLSPPPVNGE